MNYHKSKMAVEFSIKSENGISRPGLVGITVPTNDFNIALHIAKEGLDKKLPGILECETILHADIVTISEITFDGTHHEIERHVILRIEKVKDEFFLQNMTKHPLYFAVGIK